MKPGVRALGIAESFREERSTLAGAVVTASRVVDGFEFSSCTVGGTDATDAIRSLHADLDREDVQYLLLAGIALAWYNVVDVRKLARAADRPVISISFEASEGLEPALRREFEGEALDRRLATYRSLPSRRAAVVNGQTRYLRSVGLDHEEAVTVVDAFTPEGGRPEPVRVARQAARAADAYARRITDA
ncbi:endonuclease dU [Halanaeroarchaeum sulfurireducens]|uniref:UPF0215 protein HLASA_1987 n=1 Tax=Halanaeroarchaeum sulfurireducens TaxID=1604004 RepID=A0A0F7PGP3_9EURY|nr:DUF99 family protein [Halanaeroarchaeum sulfurireducens]AKH98468.1 hypothetical protein HLASF_2001 [Halanaeroarchaeum sulfurireducens]ALG82862.1 hypothetical protein HLASA_1987 [Halanaeroarchaeum sulfurireducens]